MTCVPLATTRVTTTEPLRDAMSAVELTSPSPIFAARTRNDITIHARQTACPEANERRLQGARAIRADALARRQHAHRLRAPEFDTKLCKWLICIEASPSAATTTASTDGLGRVASA